MRELFDRGPFAQYRYVEHADARADQAAQAVNAIRSLTAFGRVTDSMDLAREAMGMLAAVVESVDDSDGRLGEIGADLADAHHEACRATVPDLVELAYWLVTRALDDAADLTDIDPLDCEELLRRAGDGRPAPVRGRGMADEPHRLGREVLDAAPCEVWTGH